MRSMGSLGGHARHHARFYAAAALGAGVWAAGGRLVLFHTVLIALAVNVAASYAR